MTVIVAKSNVMRSVDTGAAGAAIAVARPLHAGRRFIVVQKTITDSDERSVAQIMQTHAVLRS